MNLTLITGASGFVGSHLVKEMRRRGLPVRGVTRGSVPGLVTVAPYSREADWSSCLEGVEAVVHLAARVHVMQETAPDPLAEFRQVNVSATINLARQAAEVGVRRFIFVSSIKVNGEYTELGKPFTADDQPNPQDAYGLSKAEAEAALMRLGIETGMEITIIRPPLVYGAGVRGNFRSLAKWAGSGMPSLFPAVKNKRSLVHVANLSDLLITVLDHPSAANEVFLVSDGHDLSTNELFKTLAARAGRRRIGIYVPRALLEIMGKISGRKATFDRLTESLQIDMSKTSQRLGWAPADVSNLDLY